MDGHRRGYPIRAVLDFSDTGLSASSATSGGACRDRETVGKNRDADFCGARATGFPTGPGSA